MCRRPLEVAIKFSTQEIDYGRSEFQFFPLYIPAKWKISTMHNSVFFGRKFLRKEEDFPTDENSGKGILDSLGQRRLYFHLLWCYKILFGLVRVDRDDFGLSRPQNDIYRVGREITHLKNVVKCSV